MTCGGWWSDLADSLLSVFDAPTGGARLLRKLLCVDILEFSAAAGLTAVRALLGGRAAVRAAVKDRVVQAGACALLACACLHRGASGYACLLALAARGGQEGVCL